MLRYYGVPEEVTNMIKNLYEGLTCIVVHGNQLTDAFPVKTGVRQGCFLSPFLISYGNRLGHEDIYRGKIKWYPVGTHYSARRS